MSFLDCCSWPQIMETFLAHRRTIFSFSSKFECWKPDSVPKKNFLFRSIVPSIKYTLWMKQKTSYFAFIIFISVFLVISLADDGGPQRKNSKEIILLHVIWMRVHCSCVEWHKIILLFYGSSRTNFYCVSDVKSTHTFFLYEEYVAWPTSGAASKFWWNPCREYFHVEPLIFFVDFSTVSLNDICALPLQLDADSVR